MISKGSESHLSAGEFVMAELTPAAVASQLLELTRGCAMLIRGARQPMLMVTGPLYIIAGVNPAFCRLMSQPEQDFVSKPLAEGMPSLTEGPGQMALVYRTGKAVVYIATNPLRTPLEDWSFLIWPIRSGEHIVGAMIELSAIDRNLQKTQELNGALMMGSIRQHELAEAAERLAEQLREEVAERSRLVDALRGREEEFRLIVASVKDYAILLLDVDGNIAHWNDAAERLNGYKADEIIGKHFSIFYPKADREAGKPEEELRIAVAEGRFEEEGWRVRSDGAPYWASVIISALRDDAGVLRGFSKITRDITVRKNMEDVLLQTNRSLEDRAEKLERAVVVRTAELLATNEQLEAFVYSIAHDLRAPLRAMQGFASILVEEAGESLNQTCREYANRIDKSAQFMDALLIGLLTFSKVSQAKVVLEPVDLRAIVELLVSRLEKEIRDTHALIEIPGPWPTVLAHEATLSQVFFNLTSNALKFVEPGVAPRICLRTEERADFIRVCVEDNGVGIAPENQQEIFRLFNRLEGEKYPGTGIGLAIVEKGVERMGGRIGLESIARGGTRFWFELKKA